MREQIRLIKIDLFKEESKSRKKIENQGRYFFQQKILVATEMEKILFETVFVDQFRTGERVYQ